MASETLFARHPLVMRFGVLVLLPLFVVAALCLAYLRQSLPPGGNPVVGAPVAASVEIKRDAHGVPHVTAKTDDDAFFALGYLHAQDRMWQLELQRRIARGRLSEVFGEATIRDDTWMLTLGLYDSARAAWPALSDDARRSLTRYAAGINRWIETTAVLPPEFLALGVKPEPWTEIDSLAWAKMFALNLSTNMWKEISNSVASQYLTDAQRADLIRSDDLSRNLVARMPDLAGAQSMRRRLENELKIGGPYVGSNGWVVSGKLTKSGDALLANDAHQGLQMPSLWYVASLRGDRLEVSGMTLVGLPVVIFGHNRDIAWGGTAMRADVQDLYLEQLNPERPGEYLHRGKWTALESRTEALAVRPAFPAALRAAQPPALIQVRRSANGPIVSDVLGTVEQPVSLRWAALDPGDRSYESFFRLGYASNWDEFTEAFRHYVAPALNLLYADRSGNIGMLGIGRIPVRKAGHGTLPVPGWSDEFEWSGSIPFEQMPRQYNPKSGYIVSANDRNIDADYPYFISDDWAPPGRAQRIRSLIEQKLSGGGSLSGEYMLEIQRDTVDSGAARLAKYLAQLRPGSRREARALQWLRNWSGDMDRDSRAAAVFFVWTKFLRERLFADRIAGYRNRPRQDSELASIVADTTNDQLLRALTQPSAQWCDSTRAKAQPAGRLCDDVLRQSLDEALDELEKLAGRDMRDWTWGRVHLTHYAHRPFSATAVIAPVFERRVPVGGSPDTVNVADASFSESIGYERRFGPSFRQVMKAGSQGWVHYYMNSTGQSGNALSEHYDDMIEPFHEARFYRLDDGQADPAAGSLKLTPVP